jgi:hypothetical protein
MSADKDRRRFILCRVCGREGAWRDIGTLCGCGAKLAGKNVLKRWASKGTAPRHPNG